MAHEGDPPLRRHRARLGLGDVVQQRAEAQRLRRGSGRWPAARRGSRASAGASLAEPAARGRARARSTSASTERVWSWHVEVVKAALLDPPQRRQLGQDHVGDAESRPSARARRARAGAHDHAPQLGEHPLGRDAGQPGRGGPRPAPASPGSASKPSSQASRARRSVRSGSRSNAAGRDGAQPARAEVLEPAEGVDVAAAAQRLRRCALMVRSRRPRSSSIVRPVERQQVDLPASRSRATTRQAPNASDSSKAKPPAAPAERLRRPRRRSAPMTTSKSAVAPAQQPVAHARRRPATPRDDPGQRLAQRAARRSQRRPASRRDAVAVVPARHPGRDPAQHLVVDRAEPVGEVLDGLALVPVAADQDRAARRPRTAGSPAPRSTVMLSMLTVPTSG